MSHSWEWEEENTFNAYLDLDALQSQSESAIPKDEVEEFSKLMWCFFIPSSKASIFKKNLDSAWPSWLQKLQCLSVFFPLFLSALSVWWVDFLVCGWNFLRPLFSLGPSFLGYCFLGFFWYGCFWASKAFLEEFLAVIRPRCKFFSCSLMK